MKQILLIEPDPNIMFANAAWLRMHHYEVLQAFSLADADELLMENKPDVIVMEVVLPDGSGIDFCRRYKEHCKLPLLFLSGLRENSDIAAGLRAGADDYITKPHDLEVLAARIEAKLRKSNALYDRKVGTQ